MGRGMDKSKGDIDPLWDVRLTTNPVILKQPRARMVLGPGQVKSQRTCL